jgi:hypothetical protein
MTKPSDIEVEVNALVAEYAAAFGESKPSPVQVAALRRAAEWAVLANKQRATALAGKPIDLIALLRLEETAATALVAAKVPSRPHELTVHIVDPPVDQAVAAERARVASLEREVAQLKSELAKAKASPKVIEGEVLSPPKPQEQGRWVSEYMGGPMRWEGPPQQGGGSVEGGTTPGLIPVFSNVRSYYNTDFDDYHDYGGGG